MRQLTYGAAIREALEQAMEISDEVFVLGEGADDPAGIFGSTQGLADRFTKKRVMDAPLAENGFTGIAVGAALGGMRPVVVHQRMDFLLLTMVNHAAKWRYMFGGNGGSVPLTVRAVVGKGWGQAAQHSQSLQALFAHIPGLRVAMPTTPFDAKGLLLSSIFGEDPVVFVEARSLYNSTGDVPENPYLIPFGEAAIRRPGSDVTLVASSYLVPEALSAAEALSLNGIQAEVIDLRTVAPLDMETILASVRKTGRAVVIDTGSRTCGITAEIAARIGKEAFSHLQAPVERVCLPDIPTPCSSVLEQAFYPTSETIINAVDQTLAIPS
ncbi:MAG: alpha-ketoacid dehydrogenase subunit beta [bacterium]|nr:alpha-ketoacid dehydrogenase subunit beta [bacterium]